jgi:hypothetical protein
MRGDKKLAKNYCVAATDRVRSQLPHPSEQAALIWNDPPVTHQKKPTKSGNEKDRALGGCNSPRLAITEGGKCSIFAISESGKIICAHTAHSSLLTRIGCIEQQHRSSYLALAKSGINCLIKATE